MNRIDDALAPLREFVIAMTNLVERERDETPLLKEGRRHLACLIGRDDWLPDAFAGAAPGVYRQYLLHCDPLERFSVVSFVWGPGGRTPVHDHTVWGLVGVLRGAERCEEYEPRPDGTVLPRGQAHVMRPGMIEAVSPTIGDWHVVSNELPDRDSVSIHVYGGNIGAVRRHLFDPATGTIRGFVSGYSSAVLPNLWDRPPAGGGASR
jgi:predicted metal-dependent enzyme (double-stranded beta helix superfamily)